MGIGIPISVDARQVKEARREVDFLNKSLRETEDTEGLAPGKEGLQETSALIRKISEDIRRMKGLVVKGERQGGLLKKEQFQEAATLSKRIGQNMAEYTKEISKARNELAKLLAEKTKLERTSPSDPHKWVEAQERLESMKGRESELRAHYERLRRQDPKAQDLARRGVDYTDTIGGYGSAPGSGSGAGIAAIKKALVYGAAIYGGVSVLSLLRESWEKYKSQAESESGLAVRGFNFERRLSEWNYTPQEEAENAKALMRATGANDMATLDRMERFARLSNIDTGSATGFIGGYYNATGADPQKQRQAIDALLYMGKQAKDGRSEQLLGLINSNLMIASRGQGGRALTTTQASNVMAQTTALYNAPGTMGFSSNLYQTMQNALMPGGDPTSELLKWDIIGGFKGPLTPESMIELQTRRNAGLNDPNNLRRALAGARRYSKTRAGQIMYMQMVLNSFGEQGGVDKAAAIIDNGDRILGAKMPGTDDITTAIESANGTYVGTPGYSVGQRAAERELLKLSAGSGAEAILGPVEKAVLTGGDKTIKALGFGADIKGSANYDDIIARTARAKGISPAWLKGMIGAESGFNRFAVSPKGARGLMQMMPKTGAHYGLKPGQDFYDPDKSIPAGASYMADLLKRYNGDMYKASVAYNAGSYERGKELYDLYVKTGGKRGTKEAIEHAGKVMAGMDTYQAGMTEQEKYSEHLRDMKENAERNGNWGEKMAGRAVKQIIDLLTEIARKSGGGMAPASVGSLGAPLPVGDR